MEFLAEECLIKVMGESFHSGGNLSKNMGEAKNIVGDWGVDKSHGKGQKIHRRMLSWGVLLRGVGLDQSNSGEFLGSRVNSPLQVMMKILRPTQKCRRRAERIST